MNNNEMTVDNVVEKPFTLRPLLDEDLYPILDIIAKVCPEDIRPIFTKVMAKFGDLEELAPAVDENAPEEAKELAEIARKKTLEDLANDVGMDIVLQLGLAVIRNMKTVKNEVYVLLSDLSGIPADQIRKMPFGTTPKMIMAVVKDIRNRDFFGE